MIISGVSGAIGVIGEITEIDCRWNDTYHFESLVRQGVDWCWNYSRRCWTADDSGTNGINRNFRYVFS